MLLVQSSHCFVDRIVTSKKRKLYFDDQHPNFHGLCKTLDVVSSFLHRKKGLEAPNNGITGIFFCYRELFYVFSYVSLTILLVILLHHLSCHVTIM